MVQQSSALEGALWMALRSLEERAALTHEMGGRARNRGHGISASAFQEESQEATAAALLVRDLITRMSSAGWELSERRSAEPNLT